VVRIFNCSDLRAGAIRNQTCSVGMPATHDSGTEVIYLRVESTGRRAAPSRRHGGKAGSDLCRFLNIEERVSAPQR
jgi:hypothetical protein